MQKLLPYRNRSTRHCLHGVKLLKASKVLYGPTQQRLKVLGQFTALLSLEERKSYQALFVVRGLQRNLLGLPAIQALQLVSRMDTLETQETDIPKKFPKLFKGLRNLGHAYKIQLKVETRPHAIYAPCMYTYHYAAN